MSDFTPATISSALLEVPSLNKTLTVYLNKIEECMDSVDSVKAAFSFDLVGSDTYIVFNQLSFKVKIVHRVVLKESTPFMLLSFEYEEKDEIKHLLKIFIQRYGHGIVGSIDSSDIIDPDHMNIGAQIFDRLAKAAYHGGHISA